MGVKILVELKSNRAVPGTLSVLKDGSPTGFACPVLGRGASQAKGLDWRKNAGNTPTGTYAARLESTSGWNRAQYGPNGAVRLIPTSGNALVAQNEHGRKGLLIHGGSPTSDRAVPFPSTKGKSELHPTQGCLRVSDPNMACLFATLVSAGIPTAACNAPDAFVVEVVET